MKSNSLPTSQPVLWHFSHRPDGVIVIELDENAPEFAKLEAKRLDIANPHQPNLCCAIDLPKGERYHQERICPSC